ncbi:MAG: AmmeMemoRadiSam system radical SAM enzyme [Deltaproteobacteria bacterium]|nr:AmmeMemoRadiSam system radical SAM enzyme [Deltaproteobacteria bacterium]
MFKINRRKFLKYSTIFSGGIVCSQLLKSTFSNELFAKSFEPNLYEASFYERIGNGQVRCLICPQKCEVNNGGRGFCGVRENKGGKYYLIVHSRPCSINVDPIEKKPLFHYLPGEKSFSIATAGCNIACKFCQNWEISQYRPEQVPYVKATPSDIAEMAVEKACKTIAYTYTEPVVFYEFMRDTAIEGNKRGIKSVVITNAFINEKPLIELTKIVGAIKVDFKAFSDDFYRNICNGELKPVLRSMEIIKKQGVHLEIVHLTIPTLNDSDKEIREMSKWIKQNLGEYVPVHFTRFHPTYKMRNLPPTPVSTLTRAREIAISEGLKYVYTGNLPGNDGENTYCHKCGKLLIKRLGFYIRENKIKAGCCSFCGTRIPGVFT